MRYFIFVCGLFGATLGFAGTNYPDFPNSSVKIARAVNSILSLPSMPLLYSSQVPVEAEPQNVSNDILIIFNSLQDGLFPGRKRPFGLSYFAGQVAFIELGARRVYLNPKFEKALRSVVPANEFVGIMTLIMAHEIGHYFYEVYLQNSTVGLSPLGQGSYIDSNGKSDKQMALIHGEIDVIGIFLAQKLGVEPKLGLKAINYVDKSMLAMTQNIIGLSQTEREGRLWVIANYLK